MTQGTILLLIKVIDLILVAATMAPVAKRQANKLMDQLKMFAVEERDPTEAEWEEINTYTDNLMAQLRSMRTS